MLAHPEMDIATARRPRVIGAIAAALVFTDPVRSAEPPTISGTAA